LIGGANEESGMEDVMHYAIAHAHPKLTLVCDAFFPVSYGEKGLLTAQLEMESDDKSLIDLYGGKASNVISDHAYMNV
jgi:succinyl-diaminopimelate desuccinylase